MRIAAVDVDLISLPAVDAVVRLAARSPRLGRHARPPSSGSRPTTARSVRPTTSGAAPMLADIVDRVLREELVGERADRREWLWHRLWELDRTEEFPIWMFGIVDVALWDLEGRVLGVPVHRLLGTYRDSIPAYASTTTFATVGGVPRRGRPVPRARLPGDQAPRLGRRTGGRRPLPARARACRPRRRPDVRRLGRLRPRRTRSISASARRSRLPLVRGADARVQRHALQVAAERVDVPLLVGETSDGAI